MIQAPLPAPPPIHVPAPSQAFAPPQRLMAQPLIQPIQQLAPPPTLGTVLAASNLAAAAAAATPFSAPSLVQPSPEPEPEPVARASDEIVDMIWFDPALPDRARMHLPWQELIARQRPEPSMLEADDDPPEDPPEVVDRRDVLGVLTEGEATSLGDLEAAIESGTTPRGGLTPPLVLVAGELTMLFDAAESLKAALGAVAPFAMGADKKLKEAFDAAAEGLKSPWLQGSTRAIETLHGRVVEAFSQGAWSLPHGWLEQQIERAVVERRAYQRRKVLGQPRVRALLGGGAMATPAYLAEEIADLLPLFARFAVRVVAEVHLSQDQFEAQPYALKVLALGRVSALGKAPRGQGRR
jgi:hypothetical protein